MALCLRIYIALLALFLMVAIRMQAEVICNPCPDTWQDDLAVSREMITACVSGPFGNDSTHLEWTVEYSDGRQPDVSQGCVAVLMLESSVRMRARAVVCDRITCSAPSAWTPWARKLASEEDVFTCHGDFDKDGVVDMNDFFPFRQAFRRQHCSE